jgi:hypothetical protein
MSESRSEWFGFRVGIDNEKIIDRESKEVEELVPL